MKYVAIGVFVAVCAIACAIRCLIIKHRFDRLDKRAHKYKRKKVEKIDLDAIAKEYTHGEADYGTENVRNNSVWLIVGTVMVVAFVCIGAVFLRL